MRARRVSVFPNPISSARIPPGGFLVSRHNILKMEEKVKKHSFDKSNWTQKNQPYSFKNQLYTKKDFIQNLDCKIIA